MTKKICIISGPTATGKTKTSIEAALALNAEIINFDSLLFYKELSIGTAKPTEDEINKVPHHLINIRSISNPMNASEYRNETLPLLHQKLNEGKNIILTGGSGFYLRALLYGMYNSQTTPKEIHDRSEKLYKDEGITPFINFLKENDPEIFKYIHENDHYRTRRAVEHFWANNTKFSTVKENKELIQDKRYYEEMGWELHHIYLDIPKLEHFEIIKQRTKNMIKLGLLDEVKGLLDGGYSPDLKPLNSIGYKETIRFLSDENFSKEDLIEKINISTRQLAKSQRTWFKTWDKHSYNPQTDQKKILDDLQKFYNE